jgi:hypothetical protein
VPARCWWSTHLRIPAARCGSARRPSTAMALSGIIRLSRSHPPIFFSGPSHASEHPTERGVADRNPAHPPQELAPLWQGRPRALLQIGLQEPPGALVQLGLRSGTLLRGQRPSLACPWHVAFDRGDAYAKGTSRFDLGHPSVEGLDDLLGQVFRISVHPLMMTDSPVTLQGALAFQHAGFAGLSARRLCRRLAYQPELAHTKAD